MKTTAFLSGTIFYLFFSLACFSQVGIGTNSPDENSILDLQSESKGLLIPRVDFNQVPAHPSGKGLLIYVIANGPEGNDAFYYYRSSGWKRLDVPDSVNWETINNHPTTLSGYGISNAVSREGFEASDSDFVGTTNSKPLVMKSNNAEAMRITPGGKVGIGNSNPNSSAKLTITPQGSEAPLRLEGLPVASPPQNDFLVVDAEGNVTRRPNALGGITSMISYAATINVPQINNNSSYQTTIAVPGVMPGAGVLIGQETDLSSNGGTVVVHAWVQSPGYVSIKWSNVQNEKAHPPQTVYHFLLFQ